MTILGKVALPIGSVDEVRLVETVAVVNCFTVLMRKRCFSVTFDNCSLKNCRGKDWGQETKNYYLLQRYIASPAMVRMVMTQKIFTKVLDPWIWGQP